jgi:[ribosomal protein S5]-alanine N-acetyltransferase
VGTRTRLIALADAEPLTRLLVANRAFLAPYEPAQGDELFTVAVQRRAIAAQLRGHRETGGILPHEVLADEQLVGRITLSHIVRHNFQSGVIGYWIGESFNGNGHASEAVRRMLDIAFSELELHRVEASTLVGNRASQTVLKRNGFTEIGLAPRFLQIAGRWQDHILFQRLRDRL